MKVTTAIHLFSGGTWAAIELCSNNIQMSVAPVRQAGVYFAIASAIAGVTGALGTTTGGFLAQLTSTGGLTGLFALSAVLRLVALLPLVFVREPRSMSLMKLVRKAKLAGASLNIFRRNILLLPSRPQPVTVQAVELANRSQ
jgi:hypothetical protein